MWIGLVVGLTLASRLPCGVGAGTPAVPFPTMNVSILKRPMTFTWAFPVLVSLEIALISGHAERRTRLLDHEAIEPRVRRQPAHPHVHFLDLAILLRLDRHVSGRGLQAAGWHQVE